MDRILVPIDFSEESYHALDLAYQMARKSNARLILLNVIEHPTGQNFSVLGDSMPSDFESNVYILQLIKKVRRDLTEIAEDSQYSDIDIRYDIQVGNPYRSIASTIAEHDVELVVMGTKGSSGMDELLIGSNAEKVVRYAKCPVITVKNKVNITDITNIVFASSFMENNDKIIDHLKKLQKVFVGKLHLLKVNTPNNFERDKVSQELMQKFVDQYQLGDYTMNVYNELSEEDGILHFAADNDADMIALTTHGRTGLMHLLSGSIAEDIVNHAKRPVWTLNIHR